MIAALRKLQAGIPLPFPAKDRGDSGNASQVPQPVADADNKSNILDAEPAETAKPHDRAGLSLKTPKEDRTEANSHNSGILSLQPQCFRFVVVCCSIGLSPVFISYTCFSPPGRMARTDVWERTGGTDSREGRPGRPEGRDGPERLPLRKEEHAGYPDHTDTFLKWAEVRVARETDPGNQTTRTCEGTLAESRRSC